LLKKYDAAKRKEDALAEAERKKEAAAAAKESRDQASAAATNNESAVASCRSACFTRKVHELEAKGQNPNDIGGAVLLAECEMQCRR
jgi:hypothetical protein